MHAEALVLHDCCDTLSWLGASTCALDFTIKATLCHHQSYSVPALHAIHLMKTLLADAICRCECQLVAGRQSQHFVHHSIWLVH